MKGGMFVGLFIDNKHAAEEHFAQPVQLEIFDGTERSPSSTVAPSSDKHKVGSDDRVQSRVLQD